MNHTTNYQLNQWEADDQVSRLDFNADNAKIDAAIKAVDEKHTALSAAKCEIVTGSYTGDGTESRTIALGFTPKALFVTAADGATSSPSSVIHYGGLALLNHPVVDGNEPIVSIVENGFQVYYNSYDHILSNAEKTKFYFLALT